MRRLPLAKPLAVSGATLTLLASELTVVPAARAEAATARSAVISAANWGRSHGYRVAVAVVDTRAHQFYGAGDYDAAYASESIVKVFIAARLLVSGQMSGATASLAWRMITVSDDFAATALYSRVGGDSLINWVKARYNIPYLGSPPPRANWWGATRVTARGLAVFYAKVKRDRLVAPWLLNAMRNSAAYGADGQFQAFGLPAASRGAAFKSGWGQDYGDGSADFNSTGFTNRNRYAIALLAMGPGSTYGRPISDALTAIAKTLLPGGKFPEDPAHNPLWRLEWVRATGNTVRFNGWSFDKDNQPWGQVTVAVYKGTSRRIAVKTTHPRVDVNRAFHLRGTHGYRFAIAARNGRHTFCVVHFNVGPGTGNSKQCVVRTVNGTPTGTVETATPMTDRTVLMTGWAYDPDSPATSIKVRVRVDGVAVGVYIADLARTDVNSITGTPGDHGYRQRVPAQPAGTHSYCIVALNIGPPYSPNKQLGCRSLTVPPPAPLMMTPATTTTTSSAPTGATAPTVAPATAAPATTSAPIEAATPTGP